MPSKEKLKKGLPKSAFLGLSEDAVVFKKDTLPEAQDAAIALIEKGDYDVITILCVVGAWTAELPPEPEVEFKLIELDELQYGDDDE